MKKILAFTLAVCLSLSLVSCGNTKTAAEPSMSSSEDSSIESVSTQDGKDGDYWFYQSFLRSRFYL